MEINIHEGLNREHRFKKLSNTHCPQSNREYVFSPSSVRSDSFFQSGVIEHEKTERTEVCCLMAFKIKERDAKLRVPLCSDHSHSTRNRSDARRIEFVFPHCHSDCSKIRAADLGVGATGTRTVMLDSRRTIRHSGAEFFVIAQQA